MSKAAAKSAARPSGEPTLSAIVDTFVREYERTPTRLKVLDAFAAASLATALAQLLYALLVGSFPFNAFLAGFFCCIGAAVLTVSLRMQAAGSLAGAAGGGKSKSPERAFVDYFLAMTLLFLAAWNLAG